MQIRARLDDKILYMELSGEIDQHNAARTRQAVDQYADHYCANAVKAVFDLQNVSFMDSTGIGFLIGRYKKFTRYGISVYIANPSTATNRILQMSGIYTLIPKL